MPTSPNIIDVDTALKDKKDKDASPLNAANSAGSKVTWKFRRRVRIASMSPWTSRTPRPSCVSTTSRARSVCRQGSLQDNDELGKAGNEFVELKPGVPYRFTLDLKKLNGGEARLLVQGETIPKESVSQLTLYPFTAMQDAERAALLLTKALQLVQSLGLNEREIRYLLTHAADFGDVNLGNCRPSPVTMRPLRGSRPQNGSFGSCAWPHMHGSSAIWPPARTT